MRSERRRGVRGVMVGLVGVLLLVVVGGLLVSTVVTIAIWPGEVKLVAPLFCTDSQPDAFVVADTYSTGPGETSTNFSLYCMGPRGDATDHGFMKPFLLTAIVNGLVLWGLIVVLGLVFRRRRRAKIRPLQPDEPDPPTPFTSRPGVPGPGSTAGPFVN